MPACAGRQGVCIDPSTSNPWFILTDMAKILVAEDDSLLSSMVVRRLQADGYDTEAAYDGAQTLEKIKGWKPDLLLLDILMPGKNGYDVLEVMRAEGTHVSMHVVVLSNLSAKEDVERAKKYGVTDFLVKATTTLDEVAQKIKSVLLASSAGGQSGPASPLSKPGGPAS